MTNHDYKDLLIAGLRESGYISTAAEWEKLPYTALSSPEADVAFGPGVITGTPPSGLSIKVRLPAPTIALPWPGGAGIISVSAPAVAHPAERIWWHYWTIRPEEIGVDMMVRYSGPEWGWSCTSLGTIVTAPRPRLGVRLGVQGASGPNPDIVEGARMLLQLAVLAVQYLSERQGDC